MRKPDYKRTQAETELGNTEDKAGVPVGGSEPSHTISEALPLSLTLLMRLFASFHSTLPRVGQCLVLRPSGRGKYSVKVLRTYSVRYGYARTSQAAAGRPGHTTLFISHAMTCHAVRPVKQAVCATFESYTFALPACLVNGGVLLDACVPCLSR